MDVKPLQAFPGVSASVLVAGVRGGEFVALPMDALLEPLVLSERVHALDKLDGRNATKSALVPAGSPVGTRVEARLEVPAGEVWYITQVTLSTPQEVTGNFRVSTWPKELDGKDKRYLETDQAPGTTVSYDLTAASELGAELRLVGGEAVTVVATASTATTADRTVTLTVRGRKGKRLV
jgi:hypothetical protein